MQCALGDPAWAGKLDQIIHYGPFQPHLLCYSVILTAAKIYVQSDAAYILTAVFQPKVSFSLE